MTDEITGDTAVVGATPRANLALGLAIAALAAWAAGVAFSGDGDEYGWIWLVMAVLGAAAVVTGFSAREDGRPRGRALAAVVIGALLVLIFLGFVIGDAIGG